MDALSFVSALSAATSAKLNKQVAAIFKKSTLECIGLGVHSGSGGAETAVVNVLQNANDVDTALYAIIATYAPAPMCTGMATIRNLGGLMSVDSSGNTTSHIALDFNDTNFRVASAQNSVLENAPDWTRLGQWFDGLKTADLSAKAKKAVESVRACIADSTKQHEHRYMPDDVKQILMTPILDPPASTISAADEAAVFTRLAFAIVGQSWTPLLAWKPEDKPGQVMGGTNIGCVMVLDGKVIGWGLNMLAQNKTFHAETVMLGAYIAANGSVPANCHIYTTLQPCKMCAGFIVRACNNAKVYYGLRDQQLSTILTAGKTNGCTEAAATSVVSVPGVAQHQSALGTGKKTPVFLANTDNSNFYTQFGRQILTQRALMQSRVDALQRTLQQLPQVAPPKSMAERIAQQDNMDVVKRNKVTIELRNAESVLLALDQAVSVLKIVGQSGLTTTYGWSVLEDLFPQLKAVAATS
jgi:tRNA(Arg) A34 adenosine deaminase TadA